jgi:hypothetical protein
MQEGSRRECEGCQGRLPLIVCATAAARGVDGVGGHAVVPARLLLWRLCTWRQTFISPAVLGFAGTEGKALVPARAAEV